MTKKTFFNYPYPQRARNVTTVRPVRHIRNLCAEHGGHIAVHNALNALGYETRHIRHAPIDRVLGSLPKQTLENGIHVLEREL